MDFAYKQPYRVRHVISTLSRSQKFGVSDHMLASNDDTEPYGSARSLESTELGIKASTYTRAPLLMRADPSILMYYPLLFG